MSLVVVDVIFEKDKNDPDYPSQKSVGSFWSFCGRNNLPVPKGKRISRRNGNLSIKYCMEEYLVTVAKMESVNLFEINYVKHKKEPCHSVEAARQALKKKGA